MMKQKVLFYAVLMMALAMPKMARAYYYDFSAVAPSGQILYYKIVDGNAQVTTQNQYSPFYSTYPSGTLVIPATVTNGGTTYSVTSIGNKAFMYCDGLTSVTIPNSVTIISDNAFYDCDGLISITIPNSVTSIGYEAFRGCSGLISINIPNSVTSIGSCAFMYCEGLTSITLPNSVTSIGSSAFSNCSGLTSVTIPNSVTSIGDNALWGCSGLTSAVYNSTLFVFLPLSYNGSYAIPSGITAICGGAFKNCSGLTSVTIPNSVSSIGGSAFENCSGLTSITIPNSVTNIGNSAFYDCSGLTSVTIGNSVDTIGLFAFMNCSGLTSITIPNSVSSIGGRVFDGCISLDSVVMQSCTPASIMSSGIFNYQFSFPSNVVVYIDGCNCYQNYVQNSNWANLNLQVLNVALPYEYTVTSTTGGSAQGLIVNMCSGADSLRLTATAANNSHYHFSHWNDGVTTNPRIVVLTQDTAFQAVFALDTFNVTVAINNIAYGVANISTIQATYGDTIHLVATPFPGYRFVRWEYRYNNYTTSSYENPFDLLITRDQQITVYFEEIKYHLNLTSFPYEGGSTSGGGYHTPGYYTISATPAYGFHFKWWNDSVTTNPRTIHLTQDTFMIAVFEGDPYSLTLHSNNEEWGSVDGSGTYPYHSNVQIIATPAEHYHFIKWWTPDESLFNSTETVTINGNMDYYAYFAPDTFHVSVMSNNVIYGNVTGGGTFQYGDPCTVEATAYSGYRFVRWSNGVAYNPYTFVPTADVELTAIFADEGSVVNLSVNVNDPNMGSVTGGGPYAIGMVAEVEAVPNAGYHFVQWENGSTENPRHIPMVEDMSITAYFSTGTQGINEIENNEIKIYVRDGQIVVEGSDGENILIYDVFGRLVDNHKLSSGVYLVTVGIRPAKKVVVIR